MGIRIIEGGFFTTVQDLGRHGYQSLGFSVNGAMDPLALRLANIVLNNDENEAAIEMSLLGPSLMFEDHMIISLTGADMSAKLNEKYIPFNRPIAVKKGDRLKLSTAKTGMYSYLAVKGGFMLPEVLGSKSTDTKVKIGGYEGRALQAGDLLSIRTTLRARDFNWGLANDLFDYIQEEQPILHVIEGRQYEWFTTESHYALETERYRLSTQSDRMGYRLVGKQLSLRNARELITEAVAIGTIQVPPNGQPIILMADRQPTGGYPKIGQIIQADLPKLSQLRPSKSITFQKCSLAEAKDRLFHLEKVMKQLKAAAKLKWRDFQ